ncbi:conjugative transposon protein TraJ [Ferruginibacter sp.]|uniref:conjugative transposon protein TraJ n=1 Tax=Ferruginibacter sp. TaxID=1940288 RepID=UPI0019C62DBF|nr:conjugative transposon protein TraJ [Ferruginibacter sp.]MBC7628840.1 conjugative transposon protein TraJ [Ferruginibacter sp.]
MIKCVCKIAVAVGAVLMPKIIFAQGTGIASEVKSLHQVLEQLYSDMLPLCSKLIGVGRGIAGFAATWYIASRVWRHIANAEPIDFYPLFRPFVLGFAILIFPSVIAMINGVMQPTVTGTASMVEDSNKAIEVLLQRKEEAIKKTDTWQMYVGETGSGDRDKWYKYTHDNADPKGKGIFAGIGNDIKFAMAKASYNFRNSVKEWMSEVLRVLFEAASLCINTIRTFYLIVLAILGPLVFGMAVFDGFQHSLTVWIARYINVFLWLPVSNIFGSIIGKVQENMLKIDIAQVQNYGDSFFSPTDTAYLIFLLIGIVGYFTVPSVANYIVHAGGANTLLHRVTNLTTSGSQSIMNVAGNTGTASSNMVSNTISQGISTISPGNDSGNFMHNKLSGKS